MITIKNQNESYILIDTEEVSILRDISEFFTYLAPNYKHHPKYRQGKWDGKIREFKYKEKLLPKGLLLRLVKFLKSKKEEFRIDFPIGDVEITDEQLGNFIDEELQLPDNFEKRDYQLDTIKTALKWKRGVFLSPTSSGKSFIIYTICNYLNLRSLIIVPNTGLVDQMYLDFSSYAIYRDWEPIEMCSKIMGGYDKYNLNQYVISTWQSINTIPNKEEWLSQFDVVIVDEAHLAKAKVLKDIVSSATSASYKFAFTGTLDGVNVHQVMIEGLFGPVKKVTETKKLIEQGKVSDLTIRVLKCKYSTEDIKEVHKPLENESQSKYHREVKFLCEHNRRNDFIAKLALSNKGNTLILYNYVDMHGKPLYNLIKSLAPAGTIVNFVDGSVTGEARTEIRKLTEDNDNVINVCSYGTFSTGMSIVNLDNLILASPSKSRVRVLQSIGRVLRKSEKNFHSDVYDIVDDLSKGTTKNITLNHAFERMKIYRSEGFKCKIYDIDWT